MSRRKTDGERIAQRMQENWAISGVHVEATAREIDRLVRRRMAWAWLEGRLSSYGREANRGKNPYLGKK